MPWETDNVVQFKNTKLDREKKNTFYNKMDQKTDNLHPEIPIYNCC